MNFIFLDHLEPEKARKLGPWPCATTLFSYRQAKSCARQCKPEQHLEIKRSRHEQGGLVPDGIVNDIVAARLEEPDCRTGFILDGFPRTLAQAAVLDLLLKGLGKKLDAVIEIKVDDGALLDRLSGRFSCAQCGCGYHDRHKPPTRPGTCDVCGSNEFTRRADDNVETLKNRLMAYHRETSPLTGYYFAHGKLRSVDGMASVEDVEAQIERVFHAPESYKNKSQSRMTNSPVRHKRGKEKDLNTTGKRSRVRCASSRSSPCKRTLQMPVISKIYRAGARNEAN